MPDEGAQPPPSPEMQEVLEFVALMDSLRRNSEILKGQYEICSKKFDEKDGAGMNEALGRADLMMKRCSTDLQAIQTGLADAKRKLGSKHPQGAEALQGNFDSVLRVVQATTDYGAAVVDRITKGRSK